METTNLIHEYRQGESIAFVIDIGGEDFSANDCLVDILIYRRGILRGIFSTTRPGVESDVPILTRSKNQYGLNLPASLTGTLKRGEYLMEIRFIHKLTDACKIYRIGAFKIVEAKINNYAE